MRAATENIRGQDQHRAGRRGDPTRSICTHARTAGFSGSTLLFHTSRCASQTFFLGSDPHFARSGRGRFVSLLGLRLGLAWPSRVRARLRVGAARQRPSADGIGTRPLYIGFRRTVPREDEPRDDAAGPPKEERGALVLIGPGSSCGIPAAALVAGGGDGGGGGDDEEEGETWAGGDQQTLSRVASGSGRGPGACQGQSEAVGARAKGGVS